MYKKLGIGALNVRMTQEVQGPPCERLVPGIASLGFQRRSRSGAAVKKDDSAQELQAFLYIRSSSTRQVYKYSPHIGLCMTSAQVKIGCYGHHPKTLEA